MTSAGVVSVITGKVYSGLHVWIKAPIETVGKRAVWPARAVYDGASHVFEHCTEGSGDHNEGLGQKGEPRRVASSPPTPQ